MIASNAIELLEEITTEYRYNRYEEALKFAIQAIKENEAKRSKNLWLISMTRSKLN